VLVFVCALQALVLNNVCFSKLFCRKTALGRKQECGAAVN
jgi:hypothetical protein